MKLLQMSLAGGVMILVITVIRALAIERLPKKTFLALWAAALARLLAPVSLPSALSIYSLLARCAPTAAEWTAVPALPDLPVAAETAAAGAARARGAGPGLDDRLGCRRGGLRGGVRRRVWALQPDTDYTAAGISSEGRLWYYASQPVAMIYDDDGGIYMDEEAAGGCYLHVRRDSAGAISGVDVLTKEQFRELADRRMNPADIAQTAG